MIPMNGFLREPTGPNGGPTGTLTRDGQSYPW